MNRFLHFISFLGYRHTHAWGGRIELNEVAPLYGVVRPDSGSFLHRERSDAGRYLMKLKETQIKRLAQHVFQKLTEKKLLTLRSTEAKIQESIINVITKNMHEEARIEEQARNMLDQHMKKLPPGEFDSQRAFLMIKKQLAKEKKFVL